MQDLQFDVILFTVNFSLLKGLGRLHVSTGNCTGECWRFISSLDSNHNLLTLMWIKTTLKQSVSVTDTKPKNCPSEAVTLRVRAASPHSFSSCRLGNGIGGLTAGGKERRGTQRNHMTASHLITSVFAFWINCWTQSENRSDCLSPRQDLRANWSEIGKCYRQLISADCEPTVWRSQASS